MLIPCDDTDADWVIARLSCPLLPPDRDAFRSAAEAALARIACPGAGINFRTVAPLQRDYFIPPPDGSTHWDIASGHWESNKLAAKPPIEDNRDLRFTKRLRLTV